MAGFFVTATDTEVGKTLVTGCLAAVMRERGYETGVFKPMQSGHLANNPDGDARRLLALASDIADSPADICPYSFEEPVAPLLAAQLKGIHITRQDLVKRYQKLASSHRYMLVEGAGGLAVPYTSDGMVVDFAKQLDLPLIVVARPALGTVNHTILTVSYARSFGLRVAGIVVSGYGRTNPIPLSEQMNPRMIEDYAEAPLLGVLPWLGDQVGREAALQAVRDHVNLDALLGSLT